MEYYTEVESYLCPGDRVIFGTMPEEENNSEFDARITEFKSDLKKRQDKASLLMEKIVNILADYSGVW